MAESLGYRLSRGVRTTMSPPIPRAWEWAAAYTPTAARPLLDMSQGSPADPPPPDLLARLAAAAAAPLAAKYTSPKGDDALAAAMAAEMKIAYGPDADVAADDIAITAGCNLAYAAVIMALADAGDEVILPVPWYFNHQMTNNLLGIKTVALPTLPDEGFLPSPERCAALITPNTRAIALVSPNNPTGAVYPPALLASFAALAHTHNLALILDETYRDFLPGPPHALFAPSPAWAWRTTLIHLFSFSKSYRVPGLRLGLLAGAPALVRACTTALDCLQICAPHPPQVAFASPGALAALRAPVRATARALAQRQEVFRAALPAGWTLGGPGCGYFAFVRHPFAGRGADAVCARLAREAGVLALPVQFFADAGALAAGALGAGGERWIRFSVANVGDEAVREVCRRLGECVEMWGWEVDV